MRALAVFVAVVAVGVVQMYAAGPLGLSLNMNRHAVAIAVFVGGMIGVVALVFVGPALLDKVTALLRRLFRRPPPEPTPADAEQKPPGRFARLVHRFGAPFLGILGPLTIGGWAAALLGRANGFGKVELILWLAAGQAMMTASFVYTLAELTD